jgi:hypothetical protein
MVYIARYLNTYLYPLRKNPTSCPPPMGKNLTKKISIINNINLPLSLSSFLLPLYLNFFQTTSSSLPSFPFSCIFRNSFFTLVYRKFVRDRSGILFSNAEYVRGGDTWEQHNQLIFIIYIFIYECTNLISVFSKKPP